MYRKNKVRALSFDGRDKLRGAEHPFVLRPPSCIAVLCRSNLTHWQLPPRTLIEITSNKPSSFHFNLQPLSPRRLVKYTSSRLVINVLRLVFTPVLFKGYFYGFREKEVYLWNRIMDKTSTRVINSNPAFSVRSECTL